jgi:hypothetical protein
VQIVLVVWDPIWLTKFIRYNNDVQLYKNGWIVMSWPVIVSKLYTKTSNVGRKTVKIAEKELNSFYAHKYISIALR